jgi:enamine deaminase RidA (YjgF/YER057c/UK114 family)
MCVHAERRALLEGQLVHLKGQVSLDCEGQVVGKGDMRAQVRRTLENIKAVLASIGGKMADIVSLTQYATDIEQFMASGAHRRLTIPTCSPS